MFIRVGRSDAETVSVSFEGRDLRVRTGLTVAAALLEAGITHFHDAPVTASPRGPFCMMGVCFDCLLIIDGMANQQSCMTEIREGMRIERQSGTAGIIPDSRPASGDST